MDKTVPRNLPVIDFRRQSMFLQWSVMDGTWTACDVPPALVRGVALIRAGQPNICLFGHDGRLQLQVGPDQYPLAEDSPRIQWSRGAETLGLRRRFSIETAGGAVLLSQTFWSAQGDEFFSWMAARTADPRWRADNGRLWSDGVQPAVLRSS